MFIFFQTKKKQAADQSLFEKKYWVAMQKSYNCMHTNKLANLHSITCTSFGLITLWFIYKYFHG